MASIIRSPDFAQEKRKLTTRRSRDAVAVAVARAYPAQAPQEPPLAPVEPPKRAPEPDVGALVEQARQSVLEQFKAEGEKARELGRQRGMQEGLQAGAEEARKTFESELTRVRSIAGTLQAIAATGIKGLEDSAVAIAFEAVCKILGAAAVSPEAIRSAVQEAVGHAVNAEKVAVRLHPGDLSALRAAEALGDTLPSGVQVSWVADQSIELGGCVVETDSGELDARLETQIERLRATLLAARASNS